MVEHFFEEVEGEGGELVKNSRVPEIAFVASGIGVVASFPASVGLQEPDLPGFVLIVTGGVASLLSLRRRSNRRFQVLAALVVLGAAVVALHRLWHRLGVSHDWLEPLYVGTVVGYCALAFSLIRGLLRRNTDLPRA